MAASLPGFPTHEVSPGLRLMLDEIREKIGEEIEQLVHELNILLRRELRRPSNWATSGKTPSTSRPSNGSSSYSCESGT